VECIFFDAIGTLEPVHSPDAKYIFVADIMNSVVWQLDRDTGRVVQKIGRAGHAGGEFTAMYVATMDSKGNLYTVEVASGRRVQKFTPIN
jgi:sugar lactone lactonase YvrE